MMSWHAKNWWCILHNIGDPGCHDVMARKKLVDEFNYTFTTLPEEEQLKMRKHSLAVLEKYSAKDPDFAEATKILKKYMMDLGLLE